MAIKRLMLAATKVRDLSPLAGMPLEILHVQGTKETDLSALHKMPLTNLRLNGCTELTDISALRGAPLNNLCFTTAPSSPTSRRLEIASHSSTSPFRQT